MSSSDRLTPRILAVLLAAFAAWTALAYAARGPEAAARPPARAIEGRRIWQEQNCQACHQIFGLGGFLGPDLTGVVADRGDDHVRRIIREGRGIMPRLDRPAREIEDLLEFLRYAGRTGSFPPPAHPLRGFNN